MKLNTKDTKRKYLKLISLTILSIVILLILSNPNFILSIKPIFYPLHKKYPSYINQETLNWITSFIIPSGIGFSTSILLTLLITRNSKLAEIRYGINSEFRYLKKTIMDYESNFSRIYYNKSFSFTNNMVQISNMIHFPPITVYLYTEYPEIEQSIYIYHNKFKEDIIGQLYKAFNNNTLVISEVDILKELSTLTSDTLKILNSLHDAYLDNL